MPPSDPKTILITGATRGLGRALCDRFAELGHTVLGCGRSADGVAALQARLPSPHRFSVVDVADHRAVAAWASTLLDDHLVPDLLINNAALINRNAPLWDVPADEFERVLAVNVAGTAHLIRAFLPAMLARKRGVIVNLSSGWGRSTAPQVAPYCATKYAVEGLTLALAQELPDGLAAIPLNPGIINTDMLQSCFAEGARHYPSADAWSAIAAPFLLSLGPRHNGRSLTVPGQ